MPDVLIVQYISERI